MKITHYIALFCFLFIFKTNNLFAALAVRSIDTSELQTKKEIKEAVKHLSPKKQKRLKKRLERFKKKVEKHSAANGGFLDDSKFRLGAVVFAAGLILLLIGALFLGFGVIGWVGNLATLIGLILMIWAFLEYI